MEKKTTQRIIGVLVIIALAIILLPLLMGGNDSPLQTVTNKIAPLPETDENANSTQEAANAPAAANPAQNPTVNENAAQQTASANNNPPAVANTENNANSAAANPAPAPTQENPTPVAAVNNNSSAPTAAATQPQQTTAAVDTPASTPAQTTAPAPQATNTQAAAIPAVNPAAPAASANSAAANQNASTPPLKTPVNAEGKPTVAAQTDNNAFSVDYSKEENKINVQPATAQVQEPQAVKAPAPKAHATARKSIAAHAKTATWIVQLGSFKNKNNASRLLATLRADGYKAFTREFKTSTRVYVGPANNHASAIQLADKLEKSTSLRGIIISSNQLEL